jgi:hypothetical protein
MTTNEVNAVVAEAVEEMRRAQPGRPGTERAAHRAKANELMAKLTRRDLRKVRDEMAELLAAYA